MPVEIEAKIKVDSHTAVRAKLKELKATPLGEDLETNVIFDTEDRSLLAADKGLRVRSAKGSDGKEKCTLTYKGPRQPGTMKLRDETELSVGDFRKAVELLEVLKFAQVLSFEKRRQSWQVEGCKVELDELPHLGTFVEIEGASEQAVQKVQELLGLGGRPVVKTSYVGLVMSHLQDKGQGSRVLRFA
ncbi:MAG TPA: class IV adenylate cyclase [Tepidisphaeraceae bacterium]|nr:class IV adenylate cyclase [Tepidisphaeraceae bacterium]